MVEIIIEIPVPTITHKKRNANNAFKNFIYFNYKTKRVK